jgi:hypothetical protein
MNFGYGRRTKAKLHSKSICQFYSNYYSNDITASME